MYMQYVNFALIHIPLEKVILQNHELFSHFQYTSNTYTAVHVYIQVVHVLVCKRNTREDSLTIHILSCNSVPIHVTNC